MCQDNVCVNGMFSPKADCRRLTLLKLFAGRSSGGKRGKERGAVREVSSPCLLPAPSTTLLAAIDCSQCAAVMKGLSTFLRPREVKRDARSSITRCPSTLPIVFRILVKTVSAQHSSATVPRRRLRGSQHARRNGAVCVMASFERPLRASPCTRCSFCAQPHGETRALFSFGYE